ncbi:hypothetical protein [Chryseobacterium sp.]|uniref:hypothetical protein n=1 Tax=Chryseobacterium sp. TaxID=1871047 RepID=UPI0028990D7A|nr:hypothetical protein [Chryseobacterium sp.]
MIAPQELKQNNLIRDIESGRIGAVLTIGEKKCTVKMPFSKLCQSYEEYEPIELTEEWLKKFGFDSNKVAYKIDNDRFIFELYFYDAWNLNYVEKAKFGNGCVELYGYWKIHELQNLFFDLTGEELKIKEQK